MYELLTEWIVSCWRWWCQVASSQSCQVWESWTNRIIKWQKKSWLYATNIAISTQYAVYNRRKDDLSHCSRNYAHSQHSEIRKYFRDKSWLKLTVGILIFHLLKALRHLVFRYLIRRHFSDMSHCLQYWVYTTGVTNLGLINCGTVKLQTDRHMESTTHLLTVKCNITN